MRVRLFEIKSTSPTVQRKGRLLQQLSLLVLLISIINIAASFVFQLTTPLANSQFRALFIRLPTSLLFVFLVLWFVHNGRIRRASHLYCGGINLIFLFVLIIFNNDAVKILPYLMLIGIVGIATLDSVRVSIYYTLFFGTAVSIFYFLSDQYTFIDFASYSVTLIGVGTTVWVTAQYLKDAIFSSEQLAEEVQATNNQLQTRANQLQLSAEIVAQTSYSLDLEKLLHNTVNLIRDQFGFYHVSIFLLGNKKRHLYLREASGEIGQKLKKQGFKIPLSQKSIICTAVHDQKPLLSNTLQDNPLNLFEPLLQNTQSELSLPLIARGEVLGILDVQSENPNAFQSEDVSILQIMANQIAINIDNANLFAKTESRLNESKTLNDLNILLTTTMDVGEIYRRAAREFTLNLHVSRCAIASWSQPENLLVTQAEFAHDVQNNLIDEYITKYEKLDLASFPEMKHVLESHLAMMFHEDDANISDSQLNILKETNQATCFLIPLVYGVESIGLVKLFRSEPHSEFSPSDLQFAQAMASQTAVALNNATVTSNARGQVAQFSSLHRLSNVLSLAPTLKEIFNGTRREILSLVEATGMSISLLSDKEDYLDWIYGYEYGQEVDLSTIPPLPITEGFSGHVARTREIFEVTNTQEVQSQFSSVTVGADLGYWVGLPMIVANKLIGVLAVENDIPLSRRDVDLLTTIAGPVAIAINNLIQFEEVQKALDIQSRQRVLLQTAAEVAASATSVLGLEDLVQQAVDLIKDRFNLYYVGLFLVDTETRFAVLQAATGTAGEVQLQDKHQLPIGGKSLIGGATADGVPRITQDVTLNDEWLPNPHLPQTRSELALPLRVGGEIIGALTVQSDTPNVFNQDLISALLTMSDQLAVAIKNSQYLSRAESEAHNQQLIRQISAQLYQSADVDQIISIGLRAISQRLGGAPVKVILGKTQTHLPKLGMQTPED